MCSKQKMGENQAKLTDAKLMAKEILDSAKLMGISLSTNEDVALQLIQEKLDKETLTSIELENSEINQQHS